MLKIFSTYTSDVLLDKQNKSIGTQEGGPLFYIEKILKSNKIPYKAFSREAEIIVKVLKNDESGKLRTILNSKKINNINKDDIVVFSTVGREWVFGAKIHPKAKIFFDVQGYLRDRDTRDFFSKPDFIEKIYCLKGNEKEIKKIPKDILRKQKQKMLIMTRGEKGATIYFQGKRYNFGGKKLSVTNTIGAGDTFFANFIVSFLNSDGDIEKDGNFSIKQTARFLLTKK